MFCYEEHIHVYDRQRSRNGSCNNHTTIVNNTHIHVSSSLEISPRKDSGRRRIQHIVFPQYDNLACKIYKEFRVERRPHRDFETP